ncbi:MAG: SDR family oxidoreductase [Thermodesulfobacteriota bacterium]
MNRAVVVTGASGIIGRMLVSGYLAEGVAVIALSRTRPNLLTLGQDSARLLEWHEADVSQPRLGLAPACYAEVARRAGQVFHLAARTDFKDQSPESYLPVNVAGVQHALALAEAAQAPLHQVSTAFVCGDFSGEFGEDDLALGQGFRNGYEASKFLGESMLREAMAAATVPVTIHRPGIVVERHPSATSGKTFGPLLFLDAVDRLRESALNKSGHLPPILRVAGNRAAHLPLVFDDAVAACLRHCASRPEARGKTLQLVAPQPVGNAVLEAAFNDAFGCEAACFASPSDFANQAMTGLEALLARKTVPYAGYLDLGVRFRRNHLDELLGPEALPTPSRQELADSFRLFLEARRATP